MRSRSFLAILAIVVALPAHAQPKFEWPVEPKNLQVLDGVAGDGLRDVMKGFTASLGVRCNFCHVGEEGQPLTTFDFVSDAKPHKEVAREMMRMTWGIDAVMEQVQEPSEKKAEVGCVTCHLGHKKPKSATELMAELQKKDGR